MTLLVIVSAVHIANKIPNETTAIAIKLEVGEQIFMHTVTRGIVTSIIHPITIILVEIIL